CETDPVEASRLAQRALAHLREATTLAKKRQREEASPPGALTAVTDVVRREPAPPLVDYTLRVENAGGSTCQDKVYFEVDGQSLGLFQTPVTIPLRGVAKGIHSYFVRVRRSCAMRPSVDFTGSGKVTLSGPQQFRLGLCGQSLCLR